MSFRFRKSFKILPGVRLNVGKTTASFNIGKRGANINIGKRGIYSNFGIKGTGISYRSRIAGKQHERTGSVYQASKINQLEKLEKMYRKGQVSQQEYMKLRNELLNDHVVYTASPPQKQGCLSAIGKIIAAVIVFFVVIFFVMAISGNSDEPSKLEQKKESVLYKMANEPIQEKETEIKPITDEERKQIENLF